MQVRMVSKTQVVDNFAELEQIDLTNSEALMVWIARVSSSDQNNPNYINLLNHCLTQRHWSVFEMIDVTFEVYTSRAIAAQILRHRSFNFQELSQRYQKVNKFEYCEARQQAKNNRQSSIDNLDENIKIWFNEAQEQIIELSCKLYQEALDKGIARECARFMLPLNTQTRLFMKGNMRSWIHYLNVRDKEDAQLEHALIAKEIKGILAKEFPAIAKILEW